MSSTNFKTRPIQLKENPFDIETFFEAISIASDSDIEFEFMDMFISGLRKNPRADITEICTNTLLSLGYMKGN